MGPDREAQAQEVLNSTIKMIAEEFGFTVKQRLMFQNVSENYSVVQSALYLEQIPNWQPAPPPPPKEVNPIYEGDGATMTLNLLDMEAITNGNH